MGIQEKKRHLAERRVVKAAGQKQRRGWLYGSQQMGEKENMSVGLVVRNKQHRARSCKTGVSQVYLQGWQGSVMYTVLEVSVLGNSSTEQNIPVVAVKPLVAQFFVWLATCLPECDIDDFMLDRVNNKHLDARPYPHHIFTLKTCHPDSVSPAFAGQH